MTSYSSSGSSIESKSSNSSSTGVVGLGPEYPPMGLSVNASPALQQQRERYSLVLGGARKTRKNKKVIKKNATRKHKN